MRINNSQKFAAFVSFIFLGILVFSFVSLQKRRKSEDEKNHQLTENHNHRVSKFGSEKMFILSGSCYCEDIDDDQRKNVAQQATRVLTRGLSYVTAAVSSAYAFHKAKEYFEKECQRKFSGECSSIRSEIIDGTEELSNEEIESLREMLREQVEREEDAEKMGVEADRDDPVKFLCKGNCLTNSLLVVEERKKESQEFHCENIIFESEEIWESDYDLFDIKWKFHQLSLNKHCKERSERKVEFTEENFHLCSVGYVGDIDLCNIECKPIKKEHEKLIK